MKICFAYRTKELFVNRIKFSNSACPQIQTRVYHLQSVYKGTEQYSVWIFCVGFTPLLIPVIWLELTNIMFPLRMSKGIQRSTAVMP